MINQFNNKSKNKVFESKLDSNESLLLDKYRLLLKKAITKTIHNAFIYDIDDIVQESCTRLLKAIRNNNPINNLESYVYRIGVTTAIDALRKIKSRKETTLDDVCSTLQGQVDYNAPPSAEDELQTQHSIKQIKSRINQLSENRKATVVLHIQGYSIEEIANKLNWTEDTARNLIYRGMSELRSKLKYRE